jgi:very-short-patch-repair endonuclease
LRRDSTPAERKLWSLLRSAQLDGFKFRRQQRLGPFFADFACQAAKLVIEIDGETHVGVAAEQRDMQRTAFLEREGYRVIRFSNADVMGNAEGVVATIRTSLVPPAPSPSHAATQRGPLPLPQGERN